MAKKERSKRQSRQQPKQREPAVWHWRMPVAAWLVPLIILLMLLVGWLFWRPVTDWLKNVSVAGRQNAAPNSPGTELATTTTGSGQQPQVTVNTGGGSGGTGSPSGSGGGGTTTDLAQLYKEVESGDTYSQVKDLIGDPDDCIETLLGALGLQRVCTWYDGSSSMIVTFIDDNVVSKTDIGL